MIVTFILPGTYTSIEGDLFWRELGCTGTDTKVGKYVSSGDRILFTMPYAKCLRAITWNSNETKIQTKVIEQDIYENSTFYAGTAPPPPPPPPTSKIYGDVKDALTGDPIWMAIVTFDVDTVYTDTNGYYEIENPTPMSGTIKCSKSGYLTQSKWIEAPMDGTLPVNFNLIQG